MQKSDLRITPRKRSPDIEAVRALALTLRKRYLLTFPVQDAEFMLSKGWTIIITNNEY